MGTHRVVGPFVADDSFLRHVDRKRLIKDGTVNLKAFKDTHPTLSFTYQDQNLKIENGLDRYQRDKALPSGDLPGLIRLTFHDLAAALEPPLPPRPDPVPQDERYGHLHCCTDRPIDDVQRSKMAKLAEDNGIVAEFVRKKKRKDEQQ